MRTGRITMENEGYYHVISHLVPGTPGLTELQKEQFQARMRAYETFCGVNILTHSILDTHFHVLVRIPERKDLSESEIRERMTAIYSPRQIRERVAQWTLWRQQGLEQLVQRDLEALRRRMYDLSEFMKSLKQHFSQWYNRTTRRRGTLWEDRFKSLVVEGSRQALMTVAAYIDLNAVRAGIVADPKDYRWSGYGEAVAGRCGAREGLREVLAGSLGPAAGWDTVHDVYRVLLYESGEQRGVDENGRPLGVGLQPETVERVIREGGRLPRHVLLHCRVRYFSDGLVLGSQMFVDSIFQRYRDRFGPKRKNGARPLRFGDWNGLCSARDLRLTPISAPAAPAT